MKLTFREFVRQRYELNKNPIPEIIQDGWVYQVSEAIKSGKNVSDRVLNCHSEIYFDQTGQAHYRKFYIENRRHYG